MAKCSTFVYTHWNPGSTSLEAFLRNEIGIAEDAALAYLPDGRRLGTDNVSNLAEVHDQTIFVFNKYYLDGDPDEVTKLLHMQPPLQPLIEESSLRPSELGAAFHRAAQTHMQSISRIVESMQHQRSALRLASSVVDFHVLNVSDVVTDARQELDKRASLVAGVDADTELASRVQIHREFLPPAVQRAMDAGGPARTLDHYVSGERIRRAVEECRDLQERLRHIEATVKQLVDGATDVRSICADARSLDTAIALELSSQGLHSRITEVTSPLDVLVVNVEPILQGKNAYTSQCLRAFRQIHTLNAGLVALPDDFTGLRASLETKGTFSDIERLHNMVYAYGATMVEVVRRKEFSRLFHRKCQGFSEVMSNLSAAETERRQAFRDEILGQLPFDLIGMNEALPSVEISVSGGETNNHHTLERHNINDLLRVLEDSRRAPNDNEAVPVRAQEVCKNLKGLVDKIDALESGFTDQVERSRTSSAVRPFPSEVTGDRFLAVFSSPKQAVSRIPQGLERELSLARAKLENETTARRALEDRLIQAKAGRVGHSGEANENHGILPADERQQGGNRRRQLMRQAVMIDSRVVPLKPNDQDLLELAELRAVMEVVEQQLAETTTAPGADVSDRWADATDLRRAERELQEASALREAHLQQAHRADNADPLIVQLLEVAAAYRRTSTKALALAQAQAVVTVPSAPDNSEVEEVEGPSVRQPPPVDLDLTDPVGALEVLRSFDHDGFLEAIAKTGKTIRKWQKHCKGYRERSKAKISFRNFAEGDLALFLPTRNSTRPWAAFNVTGRLAEQLKTREWIVARITSILERVAEPNVEDWNQPPKQRPSKTSRPGAPAAVVAAADAGKEAGLPEE
ncbi:hypothetical protein EDB89DRAFT_1909432 [Lactarius sanguifluus]|nr:hypothetical protein EDB89DRAFT_1909432 [Lactarius sanguifluus]